MFDVGDIVYISKDATSTQLDHSSTIHPGDGPFTITRYRVLAEGHDYILNVFLEEACWWVSEGALILEADGKNPKSKLERKIAIIYKRYEERNL